MSAGQQDDFTADDIDALIRNGMLSYEDYEEPKNIMELMVRYIAKKDVSEVGRTHVFSIVKSVVEHTRDESIFQQVGAEAGLPAWSGKLYRTPFEHLTFNQYLEIITLMILLGPTAPYNVQADADAFAAFNKQSLQHRDDFFMMLHDGHPNVYTHLWILLEDMVTAELNGGDDLKQLEIIRKLLKAGAYEHISRKNMDLVGRRIHVLFYMTVRWMLKIPDEHFADGKKDFEGAAKSIKSSPIFVQLAMQMTQTQLVIERARMIYGGDVPEPEEEVGEKEEKEEKEE